MLREKILAQITGPRKPGMWVITPKGKFNPKAKEVSNKNSLREWNKGPVKPQNVKIK